MVANSHNAASHGSDTGKQHHTGGLLTQATSGVILCEEASLRSIGTAPFPF